MSTVPEILRSGAATYEQRNPIYGDNYKRIGEIMRIIFPEGLPTMDVEGWNQFGVWFMAFNKLIRYAVTPAEAPPEARIDSAHDAMVYAAMLEELTR